MLPGVQWSGDGLLLYKYRLLGFEPNEIQVPMNVVYICPEIHHGAQGQVLYQFCCVPLKRGHVTLPAVSCTLLWCDELLNS